MNTLKHTIYFLPVISTFLSCKQPKMELTLLERQELKGIPSASGITVANNSLYVIGDNTPWIYKLDQQFQLAERLPLLQGNTDSILSKKEKPDFEAMTTIKTGETTEILVFGSGSKSPERDVLVRFTPGDTSKTKEYLLEKFYSLLKSTTKLDNNTLNIEAAATSGDQLYLFNRGKNLIIHCPLNSFISYLEGNGAFPKLRQYNIKLPDLNISKATFSGASFIPNTPHIIFTASVENNQNAIDDGKILGSYVGIIKTEDLKDNYKPDCILISEKKKALKIKVESVEILSNDQQGQLELLLVTDSDGGASEILRVMLTDK